MRNLLTIQPPSDKNLDLFLTIMVFIMRILWGLRKKRYVVSVLKSINGV